MSFIGSQYLGNLLAGDYHLLWVATPSDWTIHTPGKRVGPHYQRIQNLMVKARALRMQITLMGPPGYFWKLAPIRDTIEDLRLRTIYMQLCQFGIRYNHSSFGSDAKWRTSTYCNIIQSNTGHGMDM